MSFFFQYPPLISSCLFLWTHLKLCESEFFRWTTACLSGYFACSYALTCLFLFFCMLSLNLGVIWLISHVEINRSLSKCLNCFACVFMSLLEGCGKDKTCSSSSWLKTNKKIRFKSQINQVCSILLLKIYLRSESSSNRTQINQLSKVFWKYQVCWSRIGSKVCRKVNLGEQDLIPHATKSQNKLLANHDALIWWYERAWI